MWSHFVAVWAMKKFPLLGFLHGNKRSHFAEENEMAAAWGKFAIHHFIYIECWTYIVLYKIWSNGPCLRDSQVMLDKQYLRAPHKEKLRPWQPVRGNARMDGMESQDGIGPTCGKEDTEAWGRGGYSSAPLLNPGSQLKAWPWGPVPLGICCLTWGQRIVGCSWQHEKIENHAELRRTGDTATPSTLVTDSPGHSWRLSWEWSGKCWLGQAAPAASNLPVWPSVTGRREVGVNTRTISVAIAFPLPASLSGLWSSENPPFSFGQVKPSKQTQLLSLTCFCSEKIKEAQWISELMERMLSPCS